MLSRLSRLQIASRRDVLLFVAASVLMLAVEVVWLLVLEPLVNNLAGPNGQLYNKYVLTLLVLGVAALAAFVPNLMPNWGRSERKPRASFMVRFGIALQIFGLLISPIGLLYATDPAISVPVAFAAFTAVLIGVFVAGFGGNMIAPAHA